jgi:hypothetical protein
MSVQNGAEDSIEGHETIQQAFAAVREELPERFQEFSSISVQEDSIILVPSRTKLNSTSSIFFSERDDEMLEEHGFSFQFLSRTKQGIGVEVWYEFEQ